MVSLLVAGLATRGTARMPRKGITGHDEWVVTEALATALIALEQLPAKHQPRTQMDEIKKLLVAPRLPIRNRQPAPRPSKVQVVSRNCSRDYLS
jgi:hypothetical protein